PAPPPGASGGEVQRRHHAGAARSRRAEGGRLITLDPQHLTIARRIRRAQTKGKVERPIEYLWGAFVYPNLGRYQSPAEWNRAVRHWLEHVANVRIHATTRERPIDRLTREGLVPIASLRPYDLTWTEPRKVHKDCHFSFEGNRYSVPWQ